MHSGVSVFQETEVGTYTVSKRWVNDWAKGYVRLIIYSSEPNVYLSRSVVIRMSWKGILCKIYKWKVKDVTFEGPIESKQQTASLHSSVSSTTHIHIEYTRKMFITRGGADKSLALPGRKQAISTKLRIYSTYSPTKLNTLLRPLP